MKIVVNIPAYNEEKNISKVIYRIPRKILDNEVIIQVVDDGSTDSTAKVAREAGADIVIKFKKNMGLGAAFRKGLKNALLVGADIIVNIDADGQYDPEEIVKLVRPILDRKADVVLGSRFKGYIEYMPLQKRIGNKIATFVTKQIAGIDISDAQTGFRAFNREAAMQLFPLSNYTYVQETIIQASYKNLKIIEVPVTFRKREGKSRLIKNIFSYAKRAGLVLIKYYRDYHPIQYYTFFGIILFVFILGFSILNLSYLLSGNVHSFNILLSKDFAVLNFVMVLFIGIALLTTLFMLGSVGDMIKTQRLLTEELLYRINKNYNYYDTKKLWAKKNNV